MPATLIYRVKTITGASGATGATGAPTKGAPLTNLEIDNNFFNLTTEVDTKLGATGYNAADVLTKIKTVDGAGSGLDADLLDGIGPSTGWTGASGATGFIPSNIVARDAFGNFTAGTITANLVGTVTGSVSGNAGTVTNGVVTSGSYSNPTWITALAGSKVTSIPNTSLTNSTITINGNGVALGGSVSILGTAGTWTALQTFTDTTFQLIDDGDNSKKLSFQLSNILTNTTRTLTAPDENGIIATQAYTNLLPTRANTYTALQTFRDTTLSIVDDGDATKKLAFQLSGITTGNTRTLTVPNASGTIALLDSPALTGTPTAPTATAGTNTTQLATTEFTKTAIDNALPTVYVDGMIVQTVNNRVDTKQAVTFAAPVIATPLLINGSFITSLDTIITPKYSTSKILVQMNLTYEVHWDTVFILYRDGNPIGRNTLDLNYWSGTWLPGHDADNASTPWTNHFMFLDSPGTTAATTYRLMIQSAGLAGTQAARTFYLNRSYSSVGASIYEVAGSTVLLQEIK